MRLPVPPASLLPFLALMPIASAGCSETAPADGSGGAATGGAAVIGNTGGISQSTGGSASGGAATGGAATGGAATGGVTAGGAASGGAANGGASTGGTASGGLNAGGGTSTGGSSTGGAAVAGSGGVATAGASSGGAAGGGGSSTGGGTTVSGKWGDSEDPGSACSVGTLPSVGSLSANAKLPDPFTKMDGTRITDKSEWLCRREEILREAFAFIYGDKPIPAEVSGSVSNSSITVQVTGPEGNASFSLMVDMNGATAPAAAIIYYDGGLGSPLPIPNGIASVRFSAIEASGGSGAKNGPFYDAYGSNHPAGYLTAQAWQISRVLDVLEQNPGTIDPRRVGLTGCSRNGKGAFVGGVLDNRIALTIPVESGIGGTVALRLVEVLDASNGGPEWPYHSISYVRWLSEVGLGQFTTGNSAGADNTDKLPVDMHEMMALIAPRGLYIADNPSTMYNGLDRNAAWVTASVGKMAFEGLGVGDNFSYQGASGNHCEWRQQYNASLNAMIDKFLKGNASASTGNFATDLPNAPDAADHVDWDVPTLAGTL